MDIKDCRPSAARTLRFRIEADTPQEVRIDVDEGLEVSCDEATTFGPECRIEDAPPEQELTVQVRGAGAIPAEGLGIRVFAGDTMTTATFTDEPVGDREPAVEAGLTAGAYEGTATLVAVGFADDSTPPALPPPAAMQVPLAAEVHVSGGVGVLAVEEALSPMRLLLPPAEERWVGALAVAAPTAGTVDFPSLIYLEGDTAAGSPIQILLEAPATSWTAAGRRSLGGRQAGTRTRPGRPPQGRPPGRGARRAAMTRA